MCKKASGPEGSRSAVGGRPALEENVYVSCGCCLGAVCLLPGLAGGEPC